jgi:glycosyltransferase involved in cell wall biosynthesis
MRFSLIGPTHPYKGGISQFTTLLVEHLRLKHEVQFVSFRRQYPQILFPGKAGADPSRQALFASCEYLLDPMNPGTWLKAYRRIRKMRPDALILQWWSPFWTPMLAVLTTLYKIDSPGRLLFLCHHITPPDGGPFDRRLARIVLSRADEFVVFSENDRAELFHLLPRARIHKSALPTFEIFNHTSLSPEEARRRLGYGPDDRLLLFFGFVRRYKGLSYLVRALGKVSEELNVKLLVVGEFWESEEEYRELAGTLDLQDRLQMINRYVPNEEISLYFSAADVLILPYQEATQSAVAQIAFGFNLPVISTNVGGLPEIGKDGVFGLIVPPRDEEALARAITDYFGRGLKPVFQENIRMEKHLFSWDHLTTLIQKIFERRELIQTK